MATAANKWMIYGANGYTGRLIARRAAAEGKRPVLAGRSAEKLAPLAAELGLEYRISDLSAGDLAKALEGISLVLHCAGPFSATHRPMLQACLTAGAHYLDITGEIGVFESARRQDEEARTRGISVIPGVGFDVVPTDCLAAMLAEKLPGATRLELAISALGGGVSPGTLKTVIENLPGGGVVRREGKLKPVPHGYASRMIPFSSGEQWATSIGWVM